MERDENSMGMSWACHHGNHTTCDGYCLTVPNENLYSRCRCECHLPYDQRFPDIRKDVDAEAPTGPA